MKISDVVTAEMEPTTINWNWRNRIFQKGEWRTHPWMEKQQSVPWGPQQLNSWKTEASGHWTCLENSGYSVLRKENTVVFEPKATVSCTPLFSH